ncbi:MAG: hypothetical protein QM783_12120 [Phycisphaerales bacterium]
MNTATTSQAAQTRLSGTTIYRLCVLALLTLVAWPQIENLFNGRGLSTVANAAQQQQSTPPVTAALPTFATVYPNGGITVDQKTKGGIPVVYVVNLPDIEPNNNRQDVLRVKTTK